VKRLARADEGHVADVHDDVELSFPQSAADLGELIEKRWGWKIPDVAVCEGHTAPLAALYEAFSEAARALLWVAPRGGSKTALCALLIMLDSLFRPGKEAVTVAATEAQAGRTATHLRNFLRAEENVEPEKHSRILSAIASKIIWRNGCSLEILPSTMAAVNGPHSALVIADEVELMDEAVFTQSRMISQSNGEHEALDIIVSTLKSAFGQMQSLISEVREAEGAGLEPPYEMRTWCWKEITQRQDNCRVANPDLPENQKCQCHLVHKGRDENGKPRSFDKECNGDLARADGYMRLKDVHRRFRGVSKDTWTAEMACARPSSEGALLRDFSEERHVIRGAYVPEGGHVIVGVDWGGTEPFAISYLHRQDTGRYVVFDEIYVAEVSLDKLAEMYFQKIEYWKSIVSGFRVHWVYADNTGSGKVCRLSWADRTPPIVTLAARKDVEGSVRHFVNLVESDRFYVTHNCSMLLREIPLWHRRPGAAQFVPADGFDHCLDSVRYATWGARRWFKDSGAPVTHGDGVPTRTSGPVTGYSASPWQTARGHSVGMPQPDARDFPNPVRHPISP
jgi:hypothetical protein